MDMPAFSSLLQTSSENRKISSVVQKCLMTVLLLAGAILLEIRLIYVFFASVFLNIMFHRLNISWKIFCKTAPRDLSAGTRLLKLKFAMWNFTRQKLSVGDYFESIVRRHPHKAAFLYEEQVWSYKEVEEYTNRTGHFFANHAGLSAGDTVALFLMSRLRACEAKAIVVGEELLEAIEEIRPQIEGVTIFVIGERGVPRCGLLPPQSLSLDNILHQMPTHPPEIPKVDRFNRLFYIYTSGTTGLPKAAIITHARFFYMAYGLRTMLKISRDDITYCTLPLYHTAGGILGVGQAILGGSTVVIKKKFSASKFWVDCVRYKCTIAQYIGEICRYILAQKESPLDKTHTVRMMFGNGLRAQIWTEFQKRFNVKQMAEVYGATEGNASLMNMDNTVGAVGFISRIVPSVYPVRLIRIHPDTGAPLRDAKGMCIPCRPGEPGELVGKMASSGIHKFEGYNNEEATKKKVVADVFHRGDHAFLTGDILVMDEFGYFYFRDRTGDTFRWKGENVSTNEVEAAISKSVGLEAVVVFGVTVPGYEGKAGMACITGDETRHDLRKLNEEMNHYLPPYAKPLFIRFLAQVDQTGTFKLIKNRLRDESFDPSQVGTDAIFYLDPGANEYKHLSSEAYQDLSVGKIRY